jgi:hypothetical protein
LDLLVAVSGWEADVRDGRPLRGQDLDRAVEQMAEVPPPALLARFFRVRAAVAATTGTSPTPWARTALALEPDVGWSELGFGDLHPLVGWWAGLQDLPVDTTVLVDVRRSGPVYIDGVRVDGPAYLGPGAHLVQVAGRGGQWKSRLIQSPRDIR